MQMQSEHWATQNWGQQIPVLFVFVLKKEKALTNLDCHSIQFMHFPYLTSATFGSLVNVSVNISHNFCIWAENHIVYILSVVDFSCFFFMTIFCFKFNFEFLSVITCSRYSANIFLLVGVCALNGEIKTTCNGIWNYSETLIMKTKR
jgi:hypothetical protein